MSLCSHQFYTVVSSHRDDRSSDPDVFVCFSGICSAEESIQEVLDSKSVFESRYTVFVLNPSSGAVDPSVARFATEGINERSLCLFRDASKTHETIDTSKITYITPRASFRPGPRRINPSLGPQLPL